MSDTVICNHIGCREEVDGSIESACGGSYAEDDYSCGKHFCSKHLTAEVELEDGTRVSICDKCEDYLLGTEEWYIDPIEECLVKILG